MAKRKWLAIVLSIFLPIVSTLYTFSYDWWIFVAFMSINSLTIPLILLVPTYSPFSQISMALLSMATYVLVILMIVRSIMRSKEWYEEY